MLYQKWPQRHCELYMYSMATTISSLLNPFTILRMIQTLMQSPDPQLIAMMGLDENSASIIDVNSAGKFGRTCRFGSFPSVQVQIPNDNDNWTSACSAFISQCTQRIQSISMHEQLVLSDSDKSFVPVRNAADNYTYVLAYCSLLFNNAACRDDIASLVQFLDCTYPNKRVASVDTVKFLLLECLMDQSPAQKIQSKFLSWMIWLYQGKTQYTCPDRCENTAVSKTPKKN